MKWQAEAPDFDLTRAYAAVLEEMMADMPERGRDGAVEIVLDGSPLA